MKITILILSFCMSACTTDQMKQAIDTVKPIIEAPDEPETNVRDTPIAVDPSTIAEAGEFSPDPVTVLYVFEFADGTLLKFREEHGRDIWGNYHNAGFGEITWPDGRVQSIDANKLIRHGGYQSTNVPVTTLSHGKRMYWMANSEGQIDVKKVTIFEDGWNPVVESAVLKTQNNLGITSPLISATTTIEKTK